VFIYPPAFYNRFVPSPVESPAIVIRPHPTLPRYYAAEEHRRSFVGKVFDEASGDYDRLERLMSLGSGSWYRRQALSRAGLRPGMSMLDVAVGTGLLAREAIAIVGNSGRVVGIDPSRGMLAEAAGALPIQLIRGRAEELPFAPRSFDFLAMGYALRHVADLTATLRQFSSVLRPGGLLLILELTPPRRGIARALLRAYVRHVVPALARLRWMNRRATAGSSRLLWQYYWETMASCIEPSQVLQSLSAAGFAQVRRSVELGMFSEYTAVKPS
jgi:demethylmenaquinone methyltransferase/2-methoxy-6-polyprenyl-1,4-benzoquinol methylase